MEKKLALRRGTRDGSETAVLTTLSGAPRAHMAPDPAPSLPRNGWQPPLPDFSGVPPRYLRWGRCGGKAEQTGTGPSWGKKQSPDEMVLSATTA